MVHITASVVFLAGILTIMSSVLAAEVDVSRRALSSGSFNYAWRHADSCCAQGDTGCDAGTLTVTLAATASTGNSFSATLTDSTTPFPDGFNNAMHCDSGGIICWSGVASGDTTGNVCVHYANDSSCADFTVDVEPGTNKCGIDDVNISVSV